MPLAAMTTTRAEHGIEESTSSRSDARATTSRKSTQLQGELVSPHQHLPPNLPDAFDVSFHDDGIVCKIVMCLHVAHAWCKRRQAGLPTRRIRSDGRIFFCTFEAHLTCT